MCAIDILCNTCKGKMAYVHYVQNGLGALDVCKAFVGWLCGMMYEGCMQSACGEACSEE